MENAVQCCQTVRRATNVLLLPAVAHVLQVGPRMAFQTAWSTNAVSICNNAGLPQVKPGS